MQSDQHVQPATPFQGVKRVLMTEPECRLRYVPLVFITFCRLHGNEPML